MSSLLGEGKKNKRYLKFLFTFPSSPLSPGGILYMSDNKTTNTKIFEEDWKIESLSGIPLQKRREFRAEDNKICRRGVKREKDLRVYRDLAGL